MEKTEELTETVLDALTVEMARPRIAASAQKAMHPKTEPKCKVVLLRSAHRTLVLKEAFKIEHILESGLD